MSSEALREQVDAQDTCHVRDPIETVLNDNPIQTVWRLSHLVRCYAHPFYSNVERVYGVSRLEYLTLHCLATDGKLRAQKLVEVLIRPKNTISAAVHSLIKKKLIKRLLDPSDARSALLSITPKGQELFDQILPVMIKRQANVLSPLSKAERRSLDRMLDKMIRSTPAWRHEPPSS